MENIFENVKFGDKFLTRDGRIAVFSHIFFSKEDNEIFAELMIPHTIMTEQNQDSINNLMVSLDGAWYENKYESDDDIVSHYHEPIDEKKLNKVLDDAEELRNSAKGRAETGGWYWRRWAEWGYRKAKDE